LPCSAAAAPTPAPAADVPATSEETLPFFVGSFAAASDESGFASEVCCASEVFCAGSSVAGLASEDVSFGASVEKGFASAAAGLTSGVDFFGASELFGLISFSDFDSL